MDLPVSTEYHLQAVMPVELSLPPETINSIKSTLEDIVYVVVSNHRHSLSPTRFMKERS
jgi:hypothetical protein